MDLEVIKEYLSTYDGPDVFIMEVCGSHTEAISSQGIPSMISDRIHLISGPGCPVCVSTSSYVDRLVELAKEGKVIATFGDLIRVPGSDKSLSEVKGEGARVEMVYSPLDIIELAKNEPDEQFVFAAVGFETTAPVYALLVEEILDAGLKNVQLLTSIKTMPQVIEYILSAGAKIDGFFAPGHVSVVTGYEIFEPIAEKFSVPFGVAGFTGERLITALYGIMNNIGNGVVKNYYPSVVMREGNSMAIEKIKKYFEPCDAVWRGLGCVQGSGLILKKEYAHLDAGSTGLDEDKKRNPACSCDRVLMGKISPPQCPLYGKACTPMSPQGACMVSTEGSCFSYYSNSRE
ncbi:MAG: hydrogenase formation protein HypD [Eubacterium sp.]|nr:hydrogenase formation protein HypD [Eubacterium sp.]